MPTERLPMLKAREILRLKWQQCRSHRQIATAQGVGVGTPSEIVGRARRAGITCWQEVEPLSEEELEARLYPTAAATAARPLPSPAANACQGRKCPRHRRGPHP